MTVPHGTIWRIRIIAMLWPGIRDWIYTRSFYLNLSWGVVFSEISQCSEIWHPPQAQNTQSCEESRRHFPFRQSLEVRNPQESIYLRLKQPSSKARCSKNICFMWRSSFICELSSILLHICRLSLCIVLVCSFSLFEFLIQNESSIKYPWDQSWKTHHTEILFRIYLASV